MNKFIEVKDLTIKTKKGSKVIIDNLTFQINRGDFALLRGRNGTGKTTIIKALMLDDYKKYNISGSITVGGNTNVLKIKKFKDLLKYRSQIGYVPQDDDYSGHYNLKVVDVISDSINSFSGKKISLKKIEEILLRFDFEQSESNLEKFNLDSHPNRLSGGQQRILTILANIMSRPGASLYIIDEPLNNLDYKNIPKVVELIRELHKSFPESTFLIVTHNEIFDYVDHIIEI